MRGAYAGRKWSYCSFDDNRWTAIVWVQLTAEQREYYK